MRTYIDSDILIWHLRGDIRAPYGEPFKEEGLKNILSFKSIACEIQLNSYKFIHTHGHLDYIYQGG